jgi:phospholipid/cholesterol/gamma-HCH transport system permease protein
MYSILVLSLRPFTWRRRTVRAMLARQIVLMGVDAMRFTAMIALLVGIGVVVQAQYWFGRLGHSALVAPLLVTVIIRELGPLLANLIVIQRSGNAIAVELATMRASGEVRQLDAQGLDPLIYLVIPRTLGLTISILGLSVIMIVTAFVGGYLFAAVTDVRIGSPGLFLQSIMASVNGQDLLSAAAKSTIPGFLAGVICCSEGLSVEGSSAEVQQVVTRGVQRSIIVTFLISILISAISYR